MSARLLMIALDGADGAHLDEWSTNGVLPNLTALRKKGTSTRLTAPEGIGDDGLWASFQYAAGLGEHGRFHWVQPDTSGRLRPSHLDDPNLDSFWIDLSKQGQRVAVFDVPKCGRPSPVNGIHLTDWLVHGRSFSTPQSYPESLASEVLDTFGSPPPSRCGYQVPSLTDDEVREVRAHLETSIAQKRAAGLHFLASEPWDLFLISFKEAHCGGHHLWDLADPAHAEYEVSRSERLGHPLKTIYQALDAAVGDLIEEAGDDAVVVVFTPTDMVPNATLSHLMPEVIRRANRQLDARAWTRTKRLFRDALAHLTDRVWIRAKGVEILPYNENCTALRVHGSPQERSAWIAETEDLLLELVDAETGEPVMSGIDRPSTEESGAEAHRLPDLLVRTAAGTFPRAVSSSHLGVVDAERPALRPGDHAAGGFLISTVPVRDVSRVQDLGGLAADVLR